MPDTVGLENHKQTSLRGIANKAKKDKGYRFGNLYGELNESLLTEAWRRQNKRAAGGVDRVSARDYEKDLNGNIGKLAGRLKAKRYRARLIRRHYIPKGDGRERPIGIPVVEDKLLQAGAAEILEAIYEQDFLPESYGYRRGVGAKDAVGELTFKLQYGCFGYIVEADVKGFFENLDHEWLIRMLRKRIHDEAFIGLLKKWLKAGVMEPEGKVIHPVTGSPQGSVISPVLANVYLHYVLDLWFEKVVKPRCRGKVLLCRYADDWVCAFQYREEAERFYRVLPKRLSKFHLEVAAEKTRLLRFSRFHPGPRRRFAFLGFEFYWDLDRRGERRLMKRTDRKKLRGSLRRFTDWVKCHRHYPNKRLFGELNAKMRGYYNYYGVPGNSRWLKVFYEEAMKILYKWLNRQSRKHRMNRRRFDRLLELFQVPEPRLPKQQRRLNPVLA